MLKEQESFITIQIVWDTIMIIHTNHVPENEQTHFFTIVAHALE